VKWIYFIGYWQISTEVEQNQVFEAFYGRVRR